MNTLLLTLDTWDLCVDANGNIAMATEPYSLAQDAASAIRLFLGELWYDTTQGIPYFQQVLGEAPPLPILKAFLQTQALTVPGVTEAAVFITSFAERTLAGQVQVTDAAGNITTASF